jgi:hypothetical protein
VQRRNSHASHLSGPLRRHSSLSSPSSETRFRGAIREEITAEILISASLLGVAVGDGPCSPVTRGPYTEFGPERVCDTPLIRHMALPEDIRQPVAWLLMVL